MTLTKSLAACGMILTTATPAAAFDSYTWAAAYDRFRTEIVDVIGGSKPASTGVQAATTAPIARTSYLATNLPAATSPVVRAPVATAPVFTAPVPPAPAVAPAVSAPVVSPAYLRPAALPARTAPVAKTPATTTTTRTTTPTLLSYRPATTVQTTRTGTSSQVFDFGDFSFSSIFGAVNAAIAAYSGAVVAAVTETTSNVVEAVAETASKASDAVVETVTSAVTSVVETVSKIALTPELSSQPAVVAPLVQAPVDSTTDSGTSTGSIATAPAPAPSDPVSDPAPVAPTPPAPDGEYIAPQGSGTVYYVDFASGDDANSGTSTSKPWKRAPGDALATGTPASIVLKGGDTVRFKGGVSYRGELRVKFSGTAQEPIVFTGTGYGTGSAIFDGADSVTSSVPCPSQSACGGATNWSSLRLVKYKEPAGTSYRKLFDEAGALFEAKAPVASDPFWGDNISEMAVIPVAQASALQTGRLENAELAAAATGQPNARLLLWESGNVVNEYRILSISGSTILFDATGLTPYTDRDSRGAIVGSLKAVTKPGLYGILSPGTAVVFPRKNGGTGFFIGSGRFAFNMNGQSNIVIGGFEFLRGTADSTEWYRGVAIANHSSDVVKNLVVERNRFAHAGLKTGRGIIHLGTSDGVTIRNNSLSDVEFGSGMRLFGRNFTVERNRLQRIGRTGIYMGGMINGTVRSNILADLRGVHGNAMSFYLANNNIQVTNNCVFGSTRPLTWHGNKSAPMVNNLQFIGNILLSTSTGDNASASWGAFTGGVTFRNNLAIGSKYGILLNAQDTNVTVTQNRTRKIVFSGGQPAAWTVSNNQTDATYAEVANATLTMNGCRARGHSGDLVVSL